MATPVNSGSTGAAMAWASMAYGFLRRIRSQKPNRYVVILAVGFIFKETSAGWITKFTVVGDKPAPPTMVVAHTSKPFIQFPNIEINLLSPQEKFRPELPESNFLQFDTPKPATSAEAAIIENKIFLAFPVILGGESFSADIRFRVAQIIHSKTLHWVKSGSPNLPPVAISDLGTVSPSFEDVCTKAAKARAEWICLPRITINADVQVQGASTVIFATIELAILVYDNNHRFCLAFSCPDKIKVKPTFADNPHRQSEFLGKSALNAFSEVPPFQIPKA